MLLEGMHIPLTTPFFPDGRLHLRKLAQNVARYSLTPAAGMLVLPDRTGEPSLLSDEERRQVLQTAIQAAAATKVMLAGIACDGVRGAIDLIGSAHAFGYDAAVVTAPGVVGISEAETRTFFLAVADHSPLPVVLTGVSCALAGELASHPKIAGAIISAGTKELRALLEQTASIKRTVAVTHVFAAVTRRMQAASALEEASGLVGIEQLGGRTAVAAPGKPTLKARTKVVGFQVLAGTTENTLSVLQAGSMGTVPALAAAIPQGCYEVFAAWKDGDLPLAQEKQQRVLEAAKKIEGEFGVAGVKYGCDLNGYFGGTPRLPLLPLTGSQRVEVERRLQGLKT